jgi:hypothetical protein
VSFHTKPVQVGEAENSDIWLAKKLIGCYGTLVMSSLSEPSPARPARATTLNTAPGVTRFTSVAAINRKSERRMHVCACSAVPWRGAYRCAGAGARRGRVRA